MPGRDASCRRSGVQSGVGGGSACATLGRECREPRMRIPSISRDGCPETSMSGGDTLIREQPGGASAERLLRDAERPRAARVRCPAHRAEQCAIATARPPGTYCTARYSDEDHGGQTAIAVTELGHAGSGPAPSFRACSLERLCGAALLHGQVRGKIATDL